MDCYIAANVEDSETIISLKELYNKVDAEFKGQKSNPGGVQKPLLISNNPKIDVFGRNSLQTSTSSAGGRGYEKVPRSYNTIPPF